MYHERLARLIADHLREHVAGYLEEAAAQFADSVTLVVPKSIDTSGEVGGVIQNDKPDFLPMYTVDVMNKERSFDRENLFTFTYTGHIAGMVSAGSSESVTKTARRHASVVEAFVRRHLYFHAEQNNEFTIIEMAFMGDDYSGAENIAAEAGLERELWLGAFRCDFQLLVSEDGPGQHD